MKTRNIYIIGLLAILSAFVIYYFLSGKDEGKQNLQNQAGQQQMPNDSIHQNMQGKNNTPPSKDNLSPAYTQMLKEKEDRLKQNPTDTTAILEYATFMLESHKPDAAIEQFEKVLSKYPKKVNVYFGLATAYYAKKDYNKAEEVNNRVLTIEPNNLQAKYNLGVFAMLKKDAQKAKSIWSDIIKNHPTDPIANSAAIALQKLEAQK